MLPFFADEKKSEMVGRACIVFVGGMPTAAKHTLRLLGAEYPEMEFHHVPDVDGLSRLTAAGWSILVVVLSEGFTERLVENPASFVDRAGDARLVLAYRDGAVAARLVRAAREQPPLAGVGLLPLNVPVEVWLSCIHLLLCGEIFYPKAVLDLLVTEPETTPADAMPTDRLTPREWQVLTMIAEGSQNKRIASDLDVSEHTVKLHVHHVLKKLRVANRTGAARWYAKYGAAS